MKIISVTALLLSAFTIPAYARSVYQVPDHSHGSWSRPNLVIQDDEMRTQMTSSLTELKIPSGEMVVNYLGLDPMLKVSHFTFPGRSGELPDTYARPQCKVFASLKRINKNRLIKANPKLRKMKVVSMVIDEENYAFRAEIFVNHEIISSIEVTGWGSGVGQNMDHYYWDKLTTGLGITTSGEEGKEATATQMLKDCGFQVSYEEEAPYVSEASQE